MSATTYVSFRCDSNLERQMRIEAAKRDMNRTQYIIEALEEKLERVKEEALLSGESRDIKDE